MSARLLDGKALSAQLEVDLKGSVAEFRSSSGRAPTLAAVLVGEDPASQIYVRRKEQACARGGIESRAQRLPGDLSTEQLLALVAELNAAPSVDGILVQLPLPKQIDSRRVLDAVAPEKDVDAFHPENVGRIVQGRPRFLPCTPAGIARLLAHHGIDPSGRRAVVVGRSDIVGKPMANMLVQRGAGGAATVTVCHSQTPDLGAITREADILVAAIGRAKLITAEMVKPGAVVVDVGMNRTDDGLCGDVDFEAVRELASWITPVPGGVGPMTIAMLLENTLQAARRSSGT